VNTGVGEHMRQTDIEGFHTWAMAIWFRLYSIAWT